MVHPCSLNRKQCWVVLLSALLLLHCSAERDDATPGGRGSIAGVVTAKDGQPLSGVFVSAYGGSATSDAAGRFQIDGLALPPDRAVATLQKDGYFGLSVGTRPAPAGEATNIRAVLLPRELVGEIQDSSGGKATNGQVSIETQPLTFVDATGQPAARARVFAAYFDPESDTFGSEMPGGDFAADNAKGEDGVLESFGAAVIEAETESGEPLSLAKEAITCIKIPATMKDSAPAQIAVWSLAPGGRWKEIGVADRVDGQYCFTNGTLGPVNCDLFSRTAVLSGRVCDEAGAPRGNIRVDVGQISTMTAGDGSYSVAIPAGEQVAVASEYGSDILCKVGAGEAITLDLGACANAKKGDGKCQPAIDPGVVWKDASGRSWQTPSKEDSMRDWFTLQEAKAYCANLNLEGTGWSLPTLDDLRSIIVGCPETQTGAPLCSIEEAGAGACTCSYVPAGPAANGCYWQSVLDGYDCDYRDFWSATPADGTRAWSVEFRRAALYPDATTHQNSVMCVR